MGASLSNAVSRLKDFISQNTAFKPRSRRRVSVQSVNVRKQECTDEWVGVKVPRGHGRGAWDAEMRGDH